MADIKERLTQSHIMNQMTYATEKLLSYLARTLPTLFATADVSNPNLSCIFQTHINFKETMKTVVHPGDPSCREPDIVLNCVTAVAILIEEEYCLLAQHGCSPCISAE